MKKLSILKNSSVDEYFLIMVEKTGFEPATPWSQTKCTTKLCYFSLMVRPKGVEPLTFRSVV